MLGNRFVGSLAGGFTGSGVKQNDTNSSDVFGASLRQRHRVRTNGSNSKISGMTNTQINSRPLEKRGLRHRRRQ